MWVVTGLLSVALFAPQHASPIDTAAVSTHAARPGDDRVAEPRVARASGAACPPMIVMSSTLEPGARCRVTVASVVPRTPAALLVSAPTPQQALDAPLALGTAVLAVARATRAGELEFCFDVPSEVAIGTQLEFRCIVAAPTTPSGVLMSAPVQSIVQPRSPTARGIGARKIDQLIGDIDTTLRIPTLTQSKTAANIGGTDLGSSFEHAGHLYFLWGDTGPLGRDTITRSDAVSPWDVTFEYPFSVGGAFHPITIPNAQHGGFCVPSGGVSRGDAIFIVYTNQYNAATENMEKSLMCRSTDDGKTWANLYTLSQVGAAQDMTNTHFINVSMSIVSSDAWPGLPYTGDNLLIFGSGAYRKSKLYLAAMPAASIGTKANLRYFSGHSGGVPSWSTLESNAASLTTASGAEVGTQIGEFSAQYIPQIGRWVVLHGYVTICTASTPWGAYSEPVALWNAWDNDGYGNFLHVPSGHNPPYDSFGGSPDTYAEPDEWGGSYGPYLIPRFTRDNALGTELYFTLSTWNPYRTILMRAQWPIPSDPPIDPAGVVITPGDSSWTKSPTPWFLYFPHTNTYTGAHETWLSTWVAPNPDNDAGVMWRWLPRDERNASLEFFVHGGDQRIMLLEGSQDGPPVSGDIAAIQQDIRAGKYGRVVECMWGKNDNAVDSRAVWDLRPFDRRNLKIVVIDFETAANWNFVSVGPMTLTRFQ